MKFEDPVVQHLIINQINQTQSDANSSRIISIQLVHAHHLSEYQPHEFKFKLTEGEEASYVEEQKEMNLVGAEGGSEFGFADIGWVNGLTFKDFQEVGDQMAIRNLS